MQPASTQSSRVTQQALWSLHSHEGPAVPWSGHTINQEDQIQSVGSNTTRLPPSSLAWDQPGPWGTRRTPAEHWCTRSLQHGSRGTQRTQSHAHSKVCWKKLLILLHSSQLLHFVVLLALYSLWSPADPWGSCITWVCSGWTICRKPWDVLQSHQVTLRPVLDP